MPRKSPRDFSSMYASVKGGADVLPPYVARAVEFAVCKRCGEKVPRLVDLIESHEATCGRHGARVEDHGALDGCRSENGGALPHDDDAKSTASEKTVEEEAEQRTAGSDDEANASAAATATAATAAAETRAAPCGEVAPAEMHRTFSATVLELPQTELCRRLSCESRTLFADAVGDVVSKPGAASMGAVPEEAPAPAPLASEPSPLQETNVVGWQRYSVSFGAGRMGLEFEYDAHETRRLVVTRVSRDAAALGVRARDVLIGIGNRAVPRATDPLAVHDHLVGCARPVALHFYRLHVRRTAPRPAQRLHPPAASVAHASETTRGPGTVRAFLERFTGKHGDAHADEVPEEEAQQPRLKRVASEVLIPQLRYDKVRYRGDDDESDSEEICLASPAHRRAIAVELKPLLRPKPWELLYDSRVDGMCLEQLYAHAAKPGSRRTVGGAQLLLVRDDEGNVSGAFVDEPLRNAGDYFGTGECFVFELLAERTDTFEATSEDASRDTTECEDESDDKSEDDATRHSLVRAHRWVGPGEREEDLQPPMIAVSRSTSRDLDDDGDAPDVFRAPPPPRIPRVMNDMFVYSSHELLGFGSGGGGFALRIDEALEFGASRPCATYGNEASLLNGRENFAIDSVQVWTFAPQW